MNKKRHHKSKHYKKEDRNLKDRVMDTHNPTEEDMKIIESMCAMWWNEYLDSSYIRAIVNSLESTDDIREKEDVMKHIYYKICKKTPKFKRGVKRALFTYNFILGVPFFKKWIQEEDRSKKVNVTGMLEIDLLNLYGKLKKLKDKDIYLKLPEYDKFRIDRVLKGLVSKGALSPLPLTKYKEQYYQLAAQCDDAGWFIP